MLNKEICKKCWDRSLSLDESNTVLYKEVAELEVSPKEFVGRCYRYRERFWNNGYVSCLMDNPEIKFVRNSGDFEHMDIKFWFDGNKEYESELSHTILGRKITLPPVKQCPYYLEQIISEKDKSD
jgi:hypothetical protein